MLTVQLLGTMTGSWTRDLDGADKDASYPGALGLN